MQIIYTCPQCGNDLEELVLASMPPQHQKRCNKCGWSHIEKSDSALVRIPYSVEPESLQSFNSTLPDCCTNCVNRPKDGEIKSCNCALPVLTITGHETDSKSDAVITVTDSTSPGIATKLTTSTKYIAVT